MTAGCGQQAHAGALLQGVPASLTWTWPLEVSLWLSASPLGSVSTGREAEQATAVGL